MLCVVTGGAGFIGSHLVDALVERGDAVRVVDNCSTGTRSNLQRHLDAGRIRLEKADLLKDGWEQALEGANRVYHIAADPDVRESARSPLSPINNNVVATARVLEAMRRYHVPEIVFTSTSTVYGEASVIPTPEDYTPLEPISVYGGTKLACEALISAYCHSFDMRAFVYRFANIIGERSNHGVCWDFIQKLNENPKELEILGDGRQTKSYLEVHACVDAMLYAADHAEGAYNVFNIGSEDWIDVKSIADIVTESMGLSGVKYRFTGGSRGWVGDVPRMLLSVQKIRDLGWRPAIGSRESIKMAVSSMVEGV
ncbi:MAG TPA: NAD-dependent epimerase/dehydratase family protein [Methanomicrobiales archaeon]|nr:NAD-dependent epimerase/dehydratase family protein [Methanomicrobiales archaeon]